MSNQLKDALKKKMDVTPSSDFDSAFFEKLEKSKKPRLFSNWVTWAVSGCATASVLFIAITNYNVPGPQRVNQREFVENALEIQGALNEGISPIESDLTVSVSDEI